jgi:hypothetical protein
MERARWIDAGRHLVLAMLAGWMTREQQHVVAYLREENQVLREMLGTRRLRFTRQQRDRLALAAQRVKRSDWDRW